MDEFDAYRAPESRATRAAEEIPPDLALMAQWEWRRLIDHAVLVVEVGASALLPGAWKWFLEVPFWEWLITGAVGANVCFCAGPVAEAYLRWIGLKGRSIGPVLFGLGMAVAMLATAVSVLVYPISMAGK